MTPAKLTRREAMARAAHAGLAPALLMGGVAGSAGFDGLSSLAGRREASRFRGLVAELDYHRLEVEAMERRLDAMDAAGDRDSAVRRMEGGEFEAAILRWLAAERDLIAAIRAGREGERRTLGVRLDGRVWLAHPAGSEELRGGYGLLEMRAADVRDLDTTENGRRTNEAGRSV